MGKKMETTTIALIISIISLFVAISGWATFFYNVITSTPKINGQIFNVIIGRMNNPENPAEELTSFVVYLYLINERKNSVHILDYELEVDSGNGFEKLIRVYGIQNVQSWDFLSEMYKIEIPDFNKKLIYIENKPVEYGSPLHGFVVFASKKPQSFYIENMNNNKYRVTIIDAFQKRHRIISSTDQFPNLYLLQDIAGIKLTPIKNE